jgi:hypothetical protein
LSAYPLKIAQPFKLGQKMIRAIANKFSIRELIFPLDVKSATPEVVFAFDLDSHSLGHTDKAYLKKRVKRIPSNNILKLNASIAECSIHDRKAQLC